MDQPIKVHVDCRHYRGDVPCAPHRRSGVHCEGCNEYEPVGRRILIVKLGAIGDVIRTTPLLRRLKRDDPRCEVSWLTRYPEVLPAAVDRVYPFTLESTLTLTATAFDVVYSLDKDAESCAIADLVRSPRKLGFGLEHGRCVPLGPSAQAKWLTGLFDDVSRANKRSYQQEIFGICGYEFGGEEYLLEPPEPFGAGLPEGKPVIGLNTGCGARWASRMWPDASWEDLARLLQQTGCTVVLLGGADEHERNQRLAAATGALYLGHFPLRRFMSLVAACDVMVTAVTMALHLAVGLGRKVVLLNNVFNRHEFELYGRGVIVEPKEGCSCFYRPACTAARPCMTTVEPGTVLASCIELLQRGSLRA